MGNERGKIYRRGSMARTTQSFPVSGSGTESDDEYIPSAKYNKAPKPKVPAKESFWVGASKFVSERWQLFVLIATIVTTLSTVIAGYHIFSYDLETAKKYIKENDVKIEANKESIVRLEKEDIKIITTSGVQQEKILEMDVSLKEVQDDVRRIEIEQAKRSLTK